MARIFKIAVLIIFTIMLGISVFGQDENSQSNKLSKRTIKKEAQRQALERLKEEHEMELLRLKQEVEQQIPCSDFQDNEEFLYSTGKGQGHNYNMAIQNAIRIAQSELNKKIMSDECYKDIRQQGISLNISEVCKQMGMDKDGSCFCYVAIRVARKDLETPKYPEEGQSRQHEAAMKHIQQIINNETDSINVLQEK